MENLDDDKHTERVRDLSKNIELFSKELEKYPIPALVVDSASAIVSGSMVAVPYVVGGTLILNGVRNNIDLETILYGIASVAVGSIPAIKYKNMFGEVSRSIKQRVRLSRRIKELRQELCYMEEYSSGYKPF